MEPCCNNVIMETVGGVEISEVVCGKCLLLLSFSPCWTIIRNSGIVSTFK